MPSVKLLLLSGAVLLAVVGSLFGSAWATGVGCVVALCLLAVHPTVTDPAVSRSTRWLLRGGLLLVSLAVVVKTTGWVAGPRWGDPTVSASELIALVVDPVWQHQLFWRELAVAICLFLACVCFGVAIGRLPRQRLRRFAAAVPTVGVLRLVTVVFVVLLPAGLTGLLGSWTNVATTVMLVPPLSRSVETPGGVMF
jgi:hypothetical protein